MTNTKEADARISDEELRDLVASLEYQAVADSYEPETTVSWKAAKALKGFLSSPTEAEPVRPFQQRVQPWMAACFSEEVCADRLERGDRLLEEVLELLQSGDYPSERVAALTAYTYGRDKGEPHQEVGGVMVTLAAYCLAHGLDMHAAAEDELARIWTKIDKIRAKQAAKPVGSALPVAHPSPSGINEGLEKAAQIAESMVEIIPMWDRPGGPPGNGPKRPARPEEIVAAIRSAKESRE